MPSPNWFALCYKNKEKPLSIIIDKCAASNHFQYKKHTTYNWKEQAQYAYDWLIDMARMTKFEFNLQTHLRTKTTNCWQYNCRVWTFSGQKWFFIALALLLFDNKQNIFPETNSKRKGITQLIGNCIRHLLAKFIKIGKKWITRWMDWGDFSDDFENRCNQQIRLKGEGKLIKWKWLENVGISFAWFSAWCVPSFAQPVREWSFRGIYGIINLKICTVTVCQLKRGTYMTYIRIESFNRGSSRAQTHFYWMCAVLVHA